MDAVTVHVEAEIQPTESEEKVKKAIENIFGPTQIQVQSVQRINLLTIDADDLEALTKLYNLLRREHIRAAARATFLGGLDGKTIRFCLNKQVAFAGHVSFSQEVGESPLGPIRVRITSKEPRKIIEWLTS
jgi:predicted RNA binding protein with dsRBD fold (UPF0201 family)